MRYKTECAARKELKAHNAERKRQAEMVEKDLGLSMSAAHIMGTRDENGWEHDLWIVVLTDGVNKMKIDYRRGLDHRIEYQDLPYSNTIYHLLKGPTILMVLYAIMSNNPRGESFQDWCSNCGFSSNSRRAFDVYQASWKQIEEFTDQFPAINLEHYAPLKDY